MDGQGRSISANQNEDSGQQVEEPDDFKEKTLPFQSRRSSGNIQRLLQNVIGSADRVNRLRLFDFVKNPSDVQIRLYFLAIDFQKDVAGLNTGKFSGSVSKYQLRLYRSLIGLDP